MCGYKTARRALLTCAAIWAATAAGAETEISAHFRSARAGESTHYQPGLRLRQNWIEATAEYHWEERRPMGFAAPIWLMNTESFFQPHAFVGLGYRYWVSLVPGLGFHLRYKQVGARMDVYYYVNVGNWNVSRLQTLGVSVFF